MNVHFSGTTKVLFDDQIKAMSQTISTVLHNLIDKYMPSNDNAVRPALAMLDDRLTVNNEQSNSNVISTTDDNNNRSSIRERFRKPLDVKVTSISGQNDGKLQLTLHDGPVFHTTYLIKANLKRLTLAAILNEAIAGITEEGERKVVSHRKVEILVNKLKAVQYHASNAKDIYDIHRDIGNACISIYTMDTFWYESINSALRRLPIMTDEDFQTYLMQTYLKKTPVTTTNIPNVVYRGVQLTDEQIEQYKQTDNCFHFTSFTSTSTNRGVAEMYGNVLFIVDIQIAEIRI